MATEMQSSLRRRRMAKAAAAPLSPLQNDLARVLARLPEGMRLGCLAEVERLRLALDGSTEQAKTELAERLAVAVREMAAHQNAATNSAATAGTLTDQIASVKAAIADLPAKAGKKELAAALSEIARIVGADAGELDAAGE